MTARRPTCVVIGRRSGTRCTAEPVDAAEDAPIWLCTKHLARAMQMLREAAGWKA